VNAAHSGAPSAASTARPAKGSGRRTLILILLVGLAPLVASYTAYYFLRNDARTNYGTLLATAPAPPLEGARGDGAPFRIEDLRGKWVLVVVTGEGCDAACGRMLYATRQARTMQGAESERIARVWLAPNAAVPPADQPDLIAAAVPARATAALPGTGAAIYLVDPLGNLVLRYGDEPDIKGVSRDLGRLLKASRIG